MSGPKNVVTPFFNPGKHGWFSSFSIFSAKTSLKQGLILLSLQIVVAMLVTALLQVQASTAFGVRWVQLTALRLSVIS